VKLAVSWLREFVPVPGADEVGRRLAACGFEVASIDADVVDFEITANRPDCLSVYGLAREAAAAFDAPLAALDTSGESQRSSTGPAPLPVSIDDHRCGRYGLVVAEIEVGASPDWLVERLTASGVRPINNIVDVTNYVMLEIGQPMHAFDSARLAGPEIHVRAAREGERLTTLDGEARTLTKDLLVIADRDRAVAVAGVMGGASSEVSAATRRIAIESAWFQPAAVRAAGKRLGLKTEASARFERGADIGAPILALERALTLLERIGALRGAGSAFDLYPTRVTPRTIVLRRDRIAQLLGDTVPDGDILRILRALGFEVQPFVDGWRVGVPTFRVDVSREADLIEEVGRHWGFDRIPATFPPLRAVSPAVLPSVSRGRTIRRVLTSAGLQEASTFTFIEQAAAEPFAADPAGLVPIANPLSEKFAVLRPSLLPGLLDALVHSRRRESPNVHLFEVGSVFAPDGEQPAVAWVMTGARAEHWSAAAPRVDFFDTKGVASLIGAALGTRIEAEPADAPWLVRGQTARLVTVDRGAHAGFIGRLRPEIVATRGLGQSEHVFGGELSLAAFRDAPLDAVARILPLPRYPSIVRDLSIVVDERLPAAAVRGTIRANAPATLVTLGEFDRYQGPNVPPGRVSLSMRLTFRDTDRTLTDADVNEAVDAVVGALAREHGATLRGPSAESTT
jgi:phenylalanyl-tRNA synthetase beta chain